MRPSMSVVMTASPMLRSVTRNASRRSLARTASRVASPKPMMKEHVNRYARNPMTVPTHRAEVASRFDE